MNKKGKVLKQAKDSWKKRAKRKEKTKTHNMLFATHLCAVQGLLLFLQQIRAELFPTDGAARLLKYNRDVSPYRRIARLQHESGSDA